MFHIGAVDWSRVRDAEPTKRNHLDMSTTSAKLKRNHVKNAAAVRQGAS